MKNQKSVVLISLVLVLALFSVNCGCGAKESTYTTPQVPPTVISGPAIIISPVEEYNAIGTQHILTATVIDANDLPVAGQPIEWIINRFPEAVGDIVEIRGESPVKVDNTYAKCLSDANGQSQIVITAVKPGDTYVTAFCPTVPDESKHKAFAVKHWIDMEVDFPEDSSNLVGDEHIFIVKLLKSSNGEPLKDVSVRWTIVDNDPQLRFEQNDKLTVITKSDKKGVAKVTVKQVTEQIGENNILIEVLHQPPNRESRVAFSHIVNKKWQSPGLTITKVGPSQVMKGDNVVYQIEVTNIGDLVAMEVVVTDNIPEGMSHMTSNPVAEIKGQKVTWDVGDLTPGTSKILNLTVKANQVGRYINKSEVTSAEGLKEEAEVTTQVSFPNLSITKTGPNQAKRGSDVLYNIAVKNTGDIVASNVVVTDTIPNGMSYISSTPSATTEGKKVIWNLGNLASGASKTLSLVLKADNAGEWTNIAVVTSAEGITKEARVTTVVGVPLLSIEKYGPQLLSIEGEGIYSITVKNSGPSSATDVVVADIIPEGMSYIISDPIGIVQGNRVIWNLGTLESNQQKIITIKLRGDKEGEWINIATVNAKEVAEIQDELSIQVKPFAAMAISTEDTIDPVVVGRTTTYIITLESEGQIPATNVTLTNIIPDISSFISAEGPTQFEVVGREVRFQAIGIMKPGDVAIYRITVQAVAQGDAINRAVLRFDEFKSPVSAEEGTTFYSVTLARDLNPNTRASHQFLAIEWPVYLCLSFKEYILQAKTLLVYI